MLKVSKYFKNYNLIQSSYINLLIEEMTGFGPTSIMYMTACNIVTV